MEATDDERIPLRDSDGFLTVLSRSRRKTQRGEAEQDGQGEKTRRAILPLVLPSRLMFCTMWALVSFVGTSSMATHLLQATAGKACDRGIMDEAAGRAFVQRFAQQQQ